MSTLCGRLFSVLMVIVCFSSCVSYKPFTKDYYENGKKVGILIVVHNASMKSRAYNGASSILSKPQKKYREAIQVVQDNINTDELIKKPFEAIFKYSFKNKDYMVLPDTINLDIFETFKGEKERKVPYFRKDVRSLKKKYSVDEILFIDVNYGLEVQHSGLIEAERKCYCDIFTRIISTEDNQVYYSDISLEDYDIIGKWKTPPGYKEILYSVKRSIRRAVAVQKRKLIYPR